MILLLFFSLVLSASQNQFIPVKHPNDFGKLKTDFEIPQYNEEHVKLGNLPLENIEKIKNALERKEARLFFRNSSSIVYFLVYIIKENDISDPNIQKSYKALFEKQIAKGVLFPLTNLNLSEGTVPNTFFNKLLASLQEASNTVEINDVNSFFEVTTKNMEARNTHTFTNKNSILNRLKRAFIFEWKTFKIPQNKYSDEQKKEFQDNSSYIRGVRYLGIGLILATFSFFTLKIKAVYSKLINEIKKQLSIKAFFGK